MRQTPYAHAPTQPAMMQPNKDFILFDDPAPSLPPSQASVGSMPAAAPGAGVDLSQGSFLGSSQPTGYSMPSNMASSFTQHRSPHPNQSPLLEDVGATSAVMGTLDVTGSPQKKRQRSHGHSSSWHGLDAHQLMALQQAAQQQQSQQSLEQSPTSIDGPGLADSTAQGPTTLKDPPSGTLGAPMHDLTLGESIPNQALDNQEAINAAYANSFGSPGSNGMTHEQQERVKAQIRAELAGVDSRVFKGPLRDILQQRNFGPQSASQISPMSASSDPLQAGVAPSFSLFPDYDLGQSQSSSSSTYRSGEATPRATGSNGGGWTWPERPGQPRRRSSSFDASFTRSVSWGKNSQGFPTEIGSAAASQWTPYLSSGNLSQASSQPAMQASQAMPPPTQPLSQSQSQPQQQQQRQQQLQLQRQQQQQQQVQLQQQQQHQMAFNQANAQKGSGPDGRRALKRESSGLTVSPQQAFLDYDDVESALAHSGLGQMPSLFAPVPPGLADALAGHAKRDGANAGTAAISGTRTPTVSSASAADRQAAARTPTGKASHQKAAAGTVPSRVPMSRNDTVKPSNYPKRPGNQPHQVEGRGSTSQESGSQSSLFSPSESFDTTSTDDDEDERPYYPPHMRPSMLRGGPSSLYLNFPVKASNQGQSPAASGSFSGRRSQSFSRAESSSDLRTINGGGAWGHVRTEPWANDKRQSTSSVPRFADVSASSSDSDDDRRKRAQPTTNGVGGGSGAPAVGNGAAPNGRPKPTEKSSSEDIEADGYTISSKSKYRNTGGKPSRMMMPGMMGGYGYIPGSQESGLSVAAGVAAAQNARASGMGAGGSVDDVSMGGSQDDGSQSPSIRSSAQVIGKAPTTAMPPLRPAGDLHPFSAAGAGGTSGGKTGYRSSASSSRSPIEPKDDKIEASGEEEDDEEWDDLEGSGYEDNGAASSTSSKVPQKRRRKSKAGSAGGASDGKKAAARNSDSPTASARSTTYTLTNTGRPVAGTTGSTRCDYRSPITGAVCQTAFHRPYDLARHRETIHAREEASLVREGKLRMDQCIVLGKEVDPKKSMAVVEWKCKTCSASFSRKDAMLRHERLRHNA